MEATSSVNSEDLQEFENFLFLVWTPNPIKDNVKVIIDGELHHIIKREKFIKILKTILPYHELPVKNQVALIEMSIYQYGGWFYYSREDNQYRELREEAVEEFLNPQDLKQKPPRPDGIMSILTQTNPQNLPTISIPIQNNRKKYKKEIFRRWSHN